MLYEYFLKVAVISMIIAIRPIDVYSQARNVDTISYSGIITPFTITGNEDINFPLGGATPAGDINKDGYTDLIYTFYVADISTPDLSDAMRKSAITYGTGLNPSHEVMQNSNLYGINDFNNDGFDDVVDVLQNRILFGTSSGISNDYLNINLPSNVDYMFFAGDIDNDGFSEFIVGKESADTIFIFCGPDTVPIVAASPNLWSFDRRGTIFRMYDYDSDDTIELCIANNNYFYSHYDIKCYSINKISKKLEYECTIQKTYNNDPTPHFPNYYTDMNGDGLIDIAFVYYGTTDACNSSSFNIEVFLGSDEYPYYEDGLEIQVGNPTRFLYHAGDFNGDGSDDWYSKIDDSTMVVYYGSPDIINAGMETVYYHIDPSHLMLPQTLYYYQSISSSISGLQALDFNQDGYSDIFMDYWETDVHDRFKTIGTAVIFGAENPDFNNPMIIGNDADECFQDLLYGLHAENIGDVNKDGFDDWAVLASSACYLDVYFGGSVLDYMPDIKFMLPQTNKAICRDWSFGDLNGDGWLDFVISNSSISSVTLNISYIPPRKEVFVFLGGPTLKGNYYMQDADFILSDEDESRYYGKTVSIVGDYNADGYDDLIVSANKYSERTVYMYYGGLNLHESPDLVINGENGNYAGSFGSPVTRCGDLNADGYSDFILADAMIEDGRSLIFLGGPNADEQFDKQIVNPNPDGSHFGGLTPRKTADFDGDGYNDLFYISKYSKHIYIYKGGPAFDTIFDYMINDTNLRSSWLHYDYVREASDTGKVYIAVNWTLAAAYPEIKNYDMRLYSFEDTASNGPSMILKNRYTITGNSYASGDFNNDGIGEVMLGITYDRNYGWPKGGLIFQYDLDNATGINEDKDFYSENLIIYPNPVKNTLTADYRAFETEDARVEIIDINGNVKYLEIIHDLIIGRNYLHFNCERLPYGLYFLKISQGDITSCQKFVKAN